MKKLLLFILTASIFSFSSCCSDPVDLPEKVKTIFSKKFPDAKKVRWEKENDTEWEAEFYLNGKEYSAAYNNDGKWLETEYEINSTEIPEAVLKTLEIEFADFEIEESEIVKNPKGKFFEFELEKEEGDEDIEIEVLITTSGKIINRKIIEKEEKDDD